MKFFPFILILFAQTVTAQIKLQGKFCSPPDMAVSCLIFHSDSTFEEQFHGCMLHTSNIGMYRLKGNKIILQYDDFDSVKSTIKTDTILCLNPKDNYVDLQFSIIDSKSTEPMPFASINLSDTTIVADFDGNAQIRLKKSNRQVHFRIHYYPYQPFSFTITPDHCKRISIELATTRNNIENGTKEVFKIIKLKDGSISLKQVDTDLVYNPVVQ